MRGGRLSVARTWGSTASERALAFPCDEFLASPDDALFRAIDVEAPAPTLFRWLCQLRAAPYSYDWIDNLGRRSPRTLTPGLERLRLGQRFMNVFELVAFEPDAEVTLRLVRLRSLLGEVAVTYRVAPGSAAPTRLLVKLVVRYPGRAPGRALGRLILPWGDLVMMRRQLLNLKRLAEADGERQGGSAEPP